MSQPNVFPDAFFPYEYWPLEYWPIISITPVVADVCGCITISDISIFDVLLYDEAV